MLPPPRVASRGYGPPCRTGAASNGTWLGPHRDRRRIPADGPPCRAATRASRVVCCTSVGTVGADTTVRRGAQRLPRLRGRMRVRWATGAGAVHARRAGSVAVYAQAACVAPQAAAVEPPVLLARQGQGATRRPPGAAPRSNPRVRPGAPPPHQARPQRGGAPSRQSGYGGGARGGGRRGSHGVAPWRLILLSTGGSTRC